LDVIGVKISQQKKFHLKLRQLPQVLGFLSKEQIKFRALLYGPEQNAQNGGVPNISRLSQYFSNLFTGHTRR
jgi:hypothetical protein